MRKFKLGVALCAALALTVAAPTASATPRVRACSESMASVIGLKATVQKSKVSCSAARKLAKKTTAKCNRPEENGDGQCSFRVSRKRFQCGWEGNPSAPQGHCSFVGVKHIYEVFWDTPAPAGQEEEGGGFFGPGQVAVPES